MLVGADDDATKVRVHHPGAEPAQPANQLLEQLGHQPVDDPVQQGVAQQAVAVAAQVAVHGGQDAVGDASRAGLGGGGGGSAAGADLFDALRDHRLEDAAQEGDTGNNMNTRAKVEVSSIGLRPDG